MESPERATPRILFVEDEESISEPFTRSLEKAGFEPVNARTAAAALDLFERLSPDFVLLDLSLPDGDGRDVCIEIRRRSDVPILMLTASGTETDRVVGLELGADDYVVKPFSGREVISRIRAILRRSSMATPDPGMSPIEINDLVVDIPGRTAKVAGKEIKLSRKEFDLLAELVRNAGRVVTREGLMANVWDVNWFGSTKTLDVHIRALRKKLGDSATESRFIQTVRGVGFRFAPPEEIDRKP
ncbi:MAG: response regulator transcription factor [Solirubrobacterales bacterium]|nr:response regulator transcription factor [Solirubrobacterales bacterium]